MSVDVFGRSDIKSTSITNSRGPPGLGYKLTQDGQYDISRKRLCNLAEPLDEDDAVNLHVLKKRMIKNDEKIKDDVTKVFESSISNLSQEINNSITASFNTSIEIMIEHFKTKLEKLSQKIDSEIALTISVIDDFRDNVYKHMTQIQSDLEDLKN